MTVPRAASRRFASLAADFDAVSSANRLSVLHFLTTPRTTEEIAGHLGMTLQGTRRHMAKLAERQMIRELPGRLAGGAIRRYVVGTPRLFDLSVAAQDLAALSFRAEDDRAGDRALQGGEGAHLLLLNGPERGKKFFVADGDGAWSIGRSADCQVRLWHDPKIALEHAHLKRTGRGLVLQDKRPANGTRVDFQPIPKDGGAVLAIGNVIQIGGSFLVYQERGPRPGRGDASR